MLVILHQFGALSHCISGLVPSWISFGVSHGISVTKLADSGKKPKGLVNVRALPDARSLAQQ